MSNKKSLEEMTNELYKVITSVNNVEDCKLLLDDLCTYKEIEQMAQRVAAAKLLIEGNTYVQVIEKTDISSATLSRVSRCIQHGSGGYAKFIKKD